MRCMTIYEKMCDELIKKCKEYVFEENYEEMVSFLNKKEQQLKKCRNLLREEGKYVDALVKALK